MKKTDLVGKRFGKLEVVQESGRNKRKEVLWICECDCGNIKEVKTYNLKKGKTKSCGCKRTGSDRIDLVGEKYEKLLVIAYAGRDKSRISLYECICDCGKKKIVNIRNLKSGATKSCGCYNIEYRKSLKGNKNSNWNDSLTENDRKEKRNYEDYKIWRKNVYARDYWTCQCCKKKKGIKINAHHIESYKNNPLLRVDIYNGICLCGKCHISYHKKYGWKDATKDKFKDFLEWKKKRLERANE